MEHSLVWDLVSGWLYMGYEPPYVAPPPVEGADFDPTDYGRPQYDDLVRALAWWRALRPVPRPAPLEPPMDQARDRKHHEEEMEALLELH